MTLTAEKFLRHDAPAGTPGAGPVLSTADIERRLSRALIGTGPHSGPSKTRSKQLKYLVLQALGYTLPPGFARRHGALPAQNLDVFVQQSDNLQAWNQKLLPDRRYALIRPDVAGVIQAVRVVSGSDLLALDRTRTVTTKRQARVDEHVCALQLVNLNDTDALLPLLAPGLPDLAQSSPLDAPMSGRVIPIREVAKHLFDLPGQSFVDPGSACLLVPERSCEARNGRLDRKLLWPGQAESLI